MSDPTEKITILFTCAQCSLLKVPLDVPARGTEDVKAWMDQTLVHVAADHRRRSANCVATKVDLAIPITNADKVGGAAVN